MGKRKLFNNPFVKATPVQEEIDPRQFREPADIIEHRWRTIWAPKFGLDVNLTGRVRAVAMAKATGLAGAIPKATLLAMREPGQDDEETASVESLR